MNVYKFGGASVKDAEGVKNLFKIINTQRENLIIVVSAMGKMTDALEVLCNSYFGKTGNIAEVFQRIQDFHQQDLALGIAAIGTFHGNFPLLFRFF